MPWHVTRLQTETGTSHKFLLLSDSLEPFCPSVTFVPCVLNLWQVSKGAPYPVKAPSHSVYTRNITWPSSCSTLMAEAHVLVLLSGKVSSQDARGFGLNLVAERMLAHCSFPVGHEIFKVKREKSKADSFTLKQVILGWKEPQEVTHMHFRQARVLPTELLHIVQVIYGFIGQRNREKLELEAGALN